MNARYLFLDLETTGLDSHRDEIWEAAWIFVAPKSGLPIERRYLVRHSRPPSVWVARNTNYEAPGQRHLRLQHVCSQLAHDVALLSGDGDPVYLVGACPAFDDRFLRRAFVEIPYHYHVIDIETIIMGAFALDTPPTLHKLAELTGVTNDRPHTALGDARHVKALWDWWKAKAHEA